MTPDEMLAESARLEKRIIELEATNDGLGYYRYRLSLIINKLRAEQNAAMQSIVREG